ncbi:MAG: divergent PAP2 family protein [Prochlorotrichaceae cyanobacterium]|jgi:acid phosphatase family membrane protein YuiD
MLALIHNQVLVTALIACFLAQGLKLVVEIIQHQRLNFRVLVETGGMPSSHSALVAALAASIGQSVGWDSNEFAVASIFAIIVMYDAAGIRRAAGEQAKILNRILEDPQLQAVQEKLQAPLKELLGHTRLEVLAGSCLGVAVSFVVGAALKLQVIGVEL